MPRQASEARPADESGLLETVVAAKLGQLAPQLHRWYGEDELRAQLSEALREEVRRVFDPSLAEEFRAIQPVPGAVAGDYRNRWPGLPGVGRALVGPRFRGGDAAQPFVDVVVTTEPARTVAAYRGLLGPLRRRFALFSPRRVRVFVPSHLTPDLAAFSGAAEWDLHYLAAPIEAMLRLPVPPGSERVSLESTSAPDFYARYLATYHALYAERPEHRAYGRVESRDDMAEYAAAGTLSEVLVDGEWAGVIAAFRGAEQGMRGFVVAEFLLAGQFRGKGLGAAVQRRFAEGLPRRAGDVLMGTIDHRNGASLATAKRCGREEIGAHLWLDLG